jgi:hypothetical protein
MVTSGGVKTDLWGNERKDWSKINALEAIATVSHTRNQEETIVRVKFTTHKNEIIEREVVFTRGFHHVIVGERYDVLYDVDNPNDFVFFIHKLHFDFSHTEAIFLNPKARNYCSSDYFSDSLVSSCAVYFNFWINGNRIKAQTTFSKEDYLKLEYRHDKNKFYRLHYNKDNPQINWLDYNVPYEIKENCAFVTSDIGSRTNRQLNKAARRLKEGGTLFWTTSNIDFSDNAVINQKELTKMHQFLETYEPKGLLGRKLAIKVEIVDHRNIGEVLVAVDREK